jgi:hypothetical protein
MIGKLLLLETAGLTSSSGPMNRAKAGKALGYRVYEADQDANKMQANLKVLICKERV